MAVMIHHAISPDATRAASLDADGVLHSWDPVTRDPSFQIDLLSDQFDGNIWERDGRIDAPDKSPHSVSIVANFKRDC
jgi:hypothetical protein